MSIRLRLTLWYVALLCVGMALFAGAVLWQTDISASASIDSDLRHRAQDVSADVLRSPTLSLQMDGRDESSPHVGDATLWIRVLNTQGRVVASEGPPISHISPAVLAEQQPGIYECEHSCSSHVRQLVTPLIRYGIRIGTVQVITSMDHIEAARNQLIEAMFIAGLAILLIAGLSGWVLADRALRPVDRITRVARQIGEKDLHRRVSSAVWGQRAAAIRHDDELVRLVRVLDAMLARLEDASERRRRFTTDAAHELCTPIATISSGAEIALRYPRTRAYYEETLRHVLSESSHMGQLVDDLLLLARTEANQLRLQTELIELDELCRHTVAAFQPLAETAQIALIADIPSDPVLVMGDETRLNQVLRNLLDNALRYTPRGGRVTVSLRTHPRLLPDRESVHDSERVVLMVADTGPGVPVAERAHIFERFHRLDNNAPDREQADRVGGSGLGLAICQAIVMAHGGTITVTDAPETPTGAAFIVELPALDSDEPGTSPDDQDADLAVTTPDSVMI